MSETQTPKSGAPSPPSPVPPKLIKTPKNPKTSLSRAPTGRQRKYAAAVVAGKTKEAAKREAGYAPTTKGADIEGAAAVQELFTRLMDEAGITNVKLAKRLNEALDAKETKFFQKDGIVRDHRDVVAHHIRLEALKLAIELKGLKPVEKHEHEMSLYDLILESYGPVDDETRTQKK